MSWFNECTLSYEEFEEIKLYLMMLRLLKINSLLSIEKLDDLISKLDLWLKED